MFIKKLSTITLASMMALTMVSASYPAETAGEVFAADTLSNQVVTIAPAATAEDERAIIVEEDTTFAEEEAIYEEEFATIEFEAEEEEGILGEATYEEPTEGELMEIADIATDDEEEGILGDATYEEPMEEDAAEATELEEAEVPTALLVQAPAEMKDDEILAAVAAYGAADGIVEMDGIKYVTVTVTEMDIDEALAQLSANEVFNVQYALEYHIM